MVRFPLPRIIPILIIGVLLTIPVDGFAAGSDTTYRLFIHAYCPSVPLEDRFCGHEDEAEYRKFVLDSVQELNLMWQINGISFEPIVLPIVNDSYYSEIQACQQGTLPGGQTQKSRRLEWSMNVAQNFASDGVSLLITHDGGRCCSKIGGGSYLFAWEFNGFYCHTNADNPQNMGSLWAHEMGHHFCLPHTFSKNDFEQTAPFDPDYDPDVSSNIFDTPADPCDFEKWKVGNSPTLDQNVDGTFRVGHEWCDEGPDIPVAENSPRSLACDVECITTIGGPSGASSGRQPLASNTMSYFGCKGPVVIADGNGWKRIEGFTPDQVDRVHWCEAVAPERQWDDVCPDGDTDSDGICNSDDLCLTVPDTAQIDTDGDTVGDACDSCPEHAGGSNDLDDDGIGDECDRDIDGDGCVNIIDQHPLSAETVIGYQFDGNCGFGVEPLTRSDALDSDGDGYRNCADRDDDNDGVCDEGGPHPGNVLGTLPGGCTEAPEGLDPCRIDPNPLCFPVGAPVECAPEWLVCQGGSCVQDFFLKLKSLSNPAFEVVLDDFQILNRNISIGALTGWTLAETSQLMRGDFAAVGASGGGLELADPVVGDPLRLEVWSRATNQMVAVVLDYDDADVQVGEVGIGRFLIIDPDMLPGDIPSLKLDAVFLRGSDVADIPGDEDGDGLPDGLDNCVDLANPGQIDADQDGCGNACDPDVNNDGFMDSTDVDLMNACLSVLLSYPDVISEPDDPEYGDGYESVLPDPADLALARQCAAMDLNSDGIVDSADASLQISFLTEWPLACGDGYAGAICTPSDCDDTDVCTSDYCDPVTGLCEHRPDGCDDGDPCTVDACNTTPGAGGCDHTPDTCDDGNPCTADACEPGIGCVSIPVADGTGCSDGSQCTLADECQAGVCTGAPKDCDDGDPCTDDSCGFFGTCQNAPRTCNDGNACTADACEPGTGACLNQPTLDGFPCNDQDQCTVGNTCSAGICGAPVSCDDGLDCTIDTCGPATGCLNLVDCDDGNSCTVDSCDAGSNSCSSAPAPFLEAALEFGGSAQVFWTAAAGEDWNTYRGTIPTTGLGGPGGAAWNHVCFEKGDFGLDGPTASRDFQVPVLGEAFYYLVAERTDCGEGGTGLQRPPAVQPCPVP